ncbi:MAG: ROK family protein [Limimaricola sp.]|uniref:ROK family protein n=1 Tax=Limimaricola sp. TaxID=2211665 RepID=UPI001DE96E90|nr:ROK family protein [Limimaricola sp.]MBI1416582.1 ROK family protein [Limimaricola sp.]
MIAAGLDLGGTKIEAQVFDDDWRVAARRRIATPPEYDALVEAMADQISWAEAQAGWPVPVGISAAGLVAPATGLALTANLAASGRPFPADIIAKVGRPVAYYNDCRAFTLSEATFGAGRGAQTVVGLIIGTGIGGGLTIAGRLVPGPAAVGGEFGHMAAPAALVVRHGLPVVCCGCGREACVETLIAGPGLVRVAETVTGRHLTPPDIVAMRTSDADVARAWGIWCELVAELLLRITLMIDPDVVVLGGGLSQAEGLLDDLGEALRAAQWTGFGVPRLALAEGGDASGARGAAYAAWAEARDG